MSKSFLQIFLFDSIFFIFRLLKLYKSYFFLGYSDTTNQNFNLYNNLYNKVFLKKIYNLIFIEKNHPCMLSLIYEDEKIALKNTVNQLKYASNNEINVYLIIVNVKINQDILKNIKKIKNCKLIFLESLNLNILNNIEFEEKSKIYIYIDDESKIDFSVFQFRSSIYEKNIKPIIFIYNYKNNESLKKQNALLINSYVFYNLKTIF